MLIPKTKLGHTGCIFFFSLCRKSQLFKIVIGLLSSCDTGFLSLFVASFQ